MSQDKKICKETPVKIYGMPDMADYGHDFIEETTLWESYHLMMHHLHDENRQPNYGNERYQFTVTSEFGILYQYYCNALDISPEVAQFVDIDEQATYIKPAEEISTKAQEIYDRAVRLRNSIYKEWPEQQVTDNRESE